MKHLNNTLILFFIIAFLGIGKAQNCYEVIADMSGIDISQYQTELENAACELKQAFPPEFQDQFKVYDFGFYSLTEFVEGGFQAVWDKVVSEVPTEYYLIFGKQSDHTGIYTKFWVALKLPDRNIFFCIDELSPNLRDNLTSRYEAIANEIHEANEKNPSMYYKAEIQVMEELSEYILGLKDCCEYEFRNATSCSACVLSASQYERKLNKAGLMALDVESVIDETTPDMGDEEIGFKIVSNGITIDLDEAMILLKQEIQKNFPNISIKVYPCNYKEGCVNFDVIKNNWLNGGDDIGILIGVIGTNGKPGSVRWRMISDDDVAPTPTTYDSDTCYYFNEDKLFTHKEFCNTGIRPRGIMDVEGFDFEYEFRFADPEITPLTLTTEDVVDSTFKNTNEPMINMVYEMTKPKIFARLTEAIPNQDDKGKFKPGAFDVHFFAPWSLYKGSSGWKGPFDYSTKDFLADRKNYIFITDDGLNIVGHNYRNMGNFLWGAATYIMGVPQWIALSAAHLNNLNTEAGWTFDTPDDQYSIKLGRYYAKKMKWKTIYGGKNNIFRQ